MRKWTFYNDNDPFAAAWLRELIKAGRISNGVVDERPIQEIKPEDLNGFNRVHLFAGIGVWDYALTRAGWPDTDVVFTGSCPCPPFSAAGKKGCPFCRGMLNESRRVQFLGDGHVFGCPSCSYRDARHLWPEMWRLVEKRRPAALFGEQVASADGRTWIDIVQSDLETAGYAFAPINLCAAGFGAPHIRQRFFFVAHTDGWKPWHRPIQRSGEHGLGAQDGGTGSLADAAEARRAGTANAGADRLAPGKDRGRRGKPSRGRATDGVVDAERRRREQCDAEERGIQKPVDGLAADLVGDAESGGRGKRRRAEGPGRDRYADEPEQADRVGIADEQGLEGHARDGRPGDESRRDGEAAGRPATAAGAPGPTNGFWGDAVWLYCTDEQYRPTQPGIFPLVDGPSRNRVGLLRGAGNAIVAPVAQAFIESFLEAMRG